MESPERLYIFSAPSIPNAGTYYYKVISINEAREIVGWMGFTSAVGHDATAKLLSELLGTHIAVNRSFVKMEIGDRAIVFRPLQRIPEGTVIRTVDELKRMGYEIGLIERIV